LSHFIPIELRSEAGLLSGNSDAKILDVMMNICENGEGERANAVNMRPLFSRRTSFTLPLAILVFRRFDQ